MYSIRIRLSRCAHKYERVGSTNDQGRQHPTQIEFRSLGTSVMSPHSVGIRPVEATLDGEVYGDVSWPVLPFLCQARCSANARPAMLLRTSATPHHSG